MSLKDKVIEALRIKYPEEDISLQAFGIPYGFWIWDEEARIHVQMKSNDLDTDIKDSLRKGELSKTEIFLS